MSVLCQPYSTEMLPGVQRELPMFQFMPVASCSGTGHHREELGSFLLAPSIQLFIDTDEIPRASLSRLSSTCSKVFGVY